MKIRTFERRYDLIDENNKNLDSLDNTFEDN